MDERWWSFLIAASVMTAMWLIDTGRWGALVNLWTTSNAAYVEPLSVAPQPKSSCDFWCQLGNILQQGAQDYAAASSGGAG